MTALNRVDPRQFRLVVLVLTTALVVAAALAVYFATTRTSIVTSDSPGAFSPSIGQQDGLSATQGQMLVGEAGDESRAGREFETR